MRIIGLDLAITGAHKAVVMDERGKFLGPVISLHTRPEELADLLGRAREGASSGVGLACVMEPTGLAWLPVAIYLQQQGVVVYLVNSQQVADLRRFYKKHAKSDRIDARVLAKLYLVAQEKLHALQLPQAAVYRLQRACKQLNWIIGEITKLSNQIQALDRTVWLGGLENLVFADPMGPAARWFRQRFYNPYVVVEAGIEQIQQAFEISGEAAVDEDRCWIPALVHLAKQVCHIYGATSPYVDFAALQDEVSLKIRWLSQFETDRDQLRKQQVRPLYRQLHPSGNLETLYGVAEDSAAVFLSFIGDVSRFASVRACRGWSGMAPNSSQSSESEAKGLRISQAGPSLPKKFLFLSADVGRRYDPQLAKIYYDQMVHKGKHHTQAVCATASHLLDRIRVVLTQDRPYQLRDLDGTPLSPEQARVIIAERYTVPEAVRIRNNRRTRRESKERRAERKYARQIKRSRESSPEL